VSDNIHLYAGAYALDALPADERALYERHLASCEACRAEVDDYRATAAHLGSAEATSPPASMRAAVLAQVERTRQLPPGDGQLPRFAERVRPILLPVAAASAALALTLGGVTAYLVGENAQLRSEVAQTEQELAQLLTAPARVVLEAPQGVTAGFLYSEQDDHGVLVVPGLDALDVPLAYQLWLFHDGVPVPAGVFSAPADGGPVLFPAEAQVAGAELVAVTVEPAGGLPEPSGSVVLSGQL
jgi:anti-sigma-K factor RskA